MMLHPLGLTVKRLRSKAFSPVCLSRFLEFLPFTQITTQSPGGEGNVRCLYRKRAVWYKEKRGFISDGERD